MGKKKAIKGTKSVRTLSPKVKALNLWEVWGVDNGRWSFLTDGPTRKKAEATAKRQDVPTALVHLQIPAIK